MKEGREAAANAKANTGIAGLDEVLHGGVLRNRAYVVQGAPGTGKTTLGLQFVITGAKNGEETLFISTAESAEELHQTAHSHGWSLDDVTIHYHDTRTSNDDMQAQSVFHPAEVELQQTMQSLLELIERVNPQRLVIDSLGELRLLAGDQRSFRREMMGLKDSLANLKCTSLFSDDQSAPEQPVQSMVAGVIGLSDEAPEYGPDRRRLHIGKLRGQSYESGQHDFKICEGGIEVFPRLVAADYTRASYGAIASTGMEMLDEMLGGGVDRGASILFMGPAGSGKSLISGQIAAAAAERGERSALYLFDESVQTMVTRAAGLGMDFERYVDEGLVQARSINPAELTPGEFSHAVRTAVLEDGVRFIAIDSLTGYAHAMPDERLLILHVHELLAFCNQNGVTALLVLNQHGLPGTERRAPFDLSYIADTVLLFHLVEAHGDLRKAISTYKRRMGRHETGLRELVIGPDTVHVGNPLTVPEETGETVNSISVPSDRELGRRDHSGS